MMAKILFTISVFQRLIAMSPEQRKSEFVNSQFDEFGEPEEVKPYTLEEFAMQHFR